MNIKKLGEFALINRFSKKFAKIPKGITGIGDDCAIISKDSKTSWVVTTDLLIEDVHFITKTISPFDLGYKSLSANLSDIAAMGATPKYFFLSMSLPSNVKVSWLDDYFRGLKKLSDKHNVFLLGGDTTKSKKRISIGISAIGEADTKKIKKRSTAKAGDIICVTDYLGDSLGGLNLILKKLPIRNSDAKRLYSRHCRPEPNIKEGRFLADIDDVHAMMDVSDGIASDLNRIMEQSKVGMEIDMDSLPKSKELMSVCKKYGWNSTKIAASGGEEYCLLLTMSGRNFKRISTQFKRKFKRPLFKIGKVVSANRKLVWIKSGGSATGAPSAFKHF
jgi:thiamine-monophosphate kinase